MFSKFLWVRGANGNDAQYADVKRVLGPDVTVTGIARGKLFLSDGREAWRAGPDWIVGRQDDLCRLWDSV